MSEDEIRQMLADAVEGSTIVGQHRTRMLREFRAGASTVPFSELEMDSMGMMELCIAIEVNTGVEIVPAELAEMASLGEVVARVVERLR